MEICKKQDQHKSKFKFGINVYNYQKSAKQFLKEILIDFKHDLKKADITSRFINKDFQNISSAAALNENLLEQGLELNILFTSEKIYISQTISIQNINEYSKRDYEKPEKDALSGMLPPKLAQIMINLKSPEINTIFDPFCGSGTLLLEALLSDNNVIGSDISEKAVSDSIQNIEWLKNNYQINSKFKTSIFPLDALQMTLEHLPKTNFSIITEPYLGPALKKEPNEKEIKEIQNNIKNLIFDFFRNLSPILEKNTEIIIIFPYIRTKKKKYFLQIEKEVTKLEYEIIPLIKEETQKKLHLKINFPSLCYEREDQLIGREIWKFIKI
ncbi:hypothetical protein A2483_00140 [Candidatus Peregrinibacteria bacterium RIFOXYC2_FULL_33_13]|nr:MAG: hypothetical protein A2483_00140 [Candidatus Peregrinibacteria bacterium RIFOXYC2_FULL_33_13]